MKKKILIVSLFIIIIVCIITNIYIISHSKDNIVDVDVFSDIVYSGMKISNMSVSFNGSLSSYKAILTNISDESIDIDELFVIFYENEKEMKILALSDVKLLSNESTVIDIISEDNLESVTNIDFWLEN